MKRAESTPQHSGATRDPAANGRIGNKRVCVAAFQRIPTIPRTELISFFGS